MVFRRYDAVLFDLLTALLDSWTVWADVAGSVAVGREWRGEYLRRTYAAGAYRPYEKIVAEWPEATDVLVRLTEAGVRLGAVTNCSDALGRRAADQFGGVLDVVVTSEEAGAYKPRPEPYQLALNRLNLPPERVLFVAGSKFDIPGAAGVGMPVWWHNRVGMDRETQKLTPVAEYDNLRPLVQHVLSSSER